MTDDEFGRQAARDGRFRILSIDGGGVRGLIPAVVLVHLEQLLRRRDPHAVIADYFDLIAGTSTGGLVALGLTSPKHDGKPVMDAAAILQLYRGLEARRIFTRAAWRELPGLSTLHDLVDPKYKLETLRQVLQARLGGASLGEAVTSTMVSAYDMYAREPRFFKSWHPRSRQVSAVDAGVATAAAPTYFPPLDDGRGGALVDGGVFVNNPVMAAVVEALKREGRGAIRLQDMVVISLGTGRFEPGFRQERVARWGELGWVLPKKGEPPVVGAMLDGQSDVAHHWAHYLLNHEPGADSGRAAETGTGPGYFRFQAELPGGLPLDGVEPEQLRQLEGSARRLIDERGGDLEKVVEAIGAGSVPHESSRSDF